MAVESADPGADLIEVYYAPKAWRPCQDDPAFANSEDDEVIVLSAGEAFMYVIPSFDVLALPLRHLKIKGFSRQDGKELVLDVFVRNCLSLDRVYPSKMIIKDVTIIKVGMYACIRRYTLDEARIPKHMCLSFHLIGHLFIMLPVRCCLFTPSSSGLI